MKSLEKNIFIFIFLLIGVFFFSTDRVEADINWYGVQVECIYSDGGSYTFSYIQNDDGSYSSSVNRITYNLSGTSSLKSATSSQNTYVNNPVSSHKCKQYLKIGVVTEEDDNGNDASTSFYKFGSESNISFSSSDSGISGVSGWSAFWNGTMSSSEKAKMANNNSEVYNLVSERYILTSLAGEPDYTLTYQSSNDQATGSSSYAYIMSYGDVYILRTDAKTTLLEDGADHFSGVSVDDSGNVSGISSDGDTIYLNNPEANASVDSTGVVSYSYQYGQIRYGISTASSSVYSRAYVLFNSTTDSETVAEGELCDSIMPETSKVLKQVIQYAQILVPVLMIVLCGLDIGKIVMSGNIEEDLPKQKKKIITRLIVGVAFFFLPLVVTLLLDLLQQSGAVDAESIQSISCLFE